MWEAIPYLLFPFYALIAFDLLKGITNPRQTLLNVTGIAFIVANCVGAVYPTDAMDRFNYSIEGEWLGKATVAYLPFVVAVWTLSRVIAIRWPAGSRLRPEEALPPNVMLLIIWTAGAMAAIYVAKYGGERLAALRNVVDRDSVYTTRYAFDDNLDQVQFVRASYFCAAGIIPICFAYLIGSRPPSDRRRLLMLCSPSLAAAMLRLLCDIQRSNVIVGGTMIIGICVMAFYRPRGDLKAALGRLLVGMGMGFASVFVLLLVVVYSITDADDNPLVAGLERVMVIPSHTASLYFGAFDGGIPHRGITKMHAMGSVAGQAGDMSYWDMGEIASTVPHCANANFLAVAFSGAGWSGSTFIGVFVAVVTAAISVLLGSRDLIASLFMVVGSTYGLFVLVQTDLNAAVYTGWFSVHCTLAFFVFLRSRRGTASQRPQESRRDAGPVTGRGTAYPA